MRCKRAYTFRLYPTKKQVEKLQETLNLLRELYNAALQERCNAYTLKVKRHPDFYDEATRTQLTREHAITYSAQSSQLPEIKVLREEYQGIYSQVLQDTLRRVHKAFEAFFRRVATGHTPGYPRYKSQERFNSFGSTIENPRYLRAAQAKLARAQQALASKKRGSAWRKKAGKLVGKRSIARWRTSAKTFSSRERAFVAHLCE